MSLPKKLGLRERVELMEKKKNDSDTWWNTSNEEETYSTILVIMVCAYKIIGQENSEGNLWVSELNLLSSEVLYGEPFIVLTMIPLDIDVAITAHTSNIRWRQYLLLM